MRTTTDLPFATIPVRLLCHTRMQLIALALLWLGAGCRTSDEASHVPAGYRGTPFHDTVYAGGPQRIPGKVYCAYYDFGGEGVAYHDSTAKNLGSGGLNPSDGTYLNQFRMNEAVDTSYVKFHDQIDDNPYDLVRPPDKMLYVGWTEPGEWFNLTVTVAKAGEYTFDLLYTSHQGGTIALDVNQSESAGPISVPSTANPTEPIAWRQWHHWNLLKNAARITLPKGVSVLTVHILTEGNMNLGYLEFRPVAR